MPLLFREMNRVMKVNGCLLFSTLGPDTFKELNQAWAGINDHAHVNVFSDMHDIGDVLMAEHFLEPVMDMEYLTVHYGTLLQLLHSLKQQGVKNIHQRRNPGLTGKHSWLQFEQKYGEFRTTEGKYPLTYEVVYGHAWKGEQRKTAQGTETIIPISAIRRREVF
jgi:malonyl-CoA O-methyltransferase